MQQQNLFIDEMDNVLFKTGIQNVLLTNGVCTGNLLRRNSNKPVQRNSN